MNHLSLYSSYNSCTGVSLSFQCLSSLKVGVGNQFLTPTYSHRLHLLLLLLWTKWFFRSACVKKLVVALYSELLIFVSFNKMFSNFFREDENEFMSASYGLKRMTCYLIQWGSHGGIWDSIIAVIGDDAKSELAGVRRISLLPLWLLEVRDFESNRCPITAIMKKSHVPKTEPFSLFKVEWCRVCVHRGGDIMYTRTGDYFGKTKFYNDGAH